MSQDKMYHDFAHAFSVYKNAQILLEKLGGDEIIILTSALFHDIARDQDNHEKIGARMLEDILSNIKEFPKSKIKVTCKAVERHEKGQITHEEKILSDADKMDAFNELGVARGLMMAAKRGPTLHESISSYLQLCREKWYKNMHFDISRELIAEDKQRTEKLLDEMLDKYST
ncbi:HD domain-containing protein [Candidatus Dojkabacteria bacterium]|nr:HD domain-containing protein [Candidatus Dojkabacteria bacterium]